MGILKPPKMPAPPPLQMPDEDDVPTLEDQERERAEAEKLRQKMLNRKGRRSTILTGTGLSDIADENIEQKTLLGG